MLLTQQSQCFIRRAAFGDAAEIQQHARTRERDATIRRIQLQRTPIRRSDRFLQPIRRWQLLLITRATPQTRQISAGDVKRTLRGRGKLARARDERKKLLGGLKRLFRLLTVQTRKLALWLIIRKKGREGRKPRKHVIRRLFSLRRIRRIKRQTEARGHLHAL